MLPTKEEALRELETAGTLNPGPWIRHSMNVGVAARNIAEKVPGMDPEKAFIVGLLHDIGRRVGIVDIPTHIYEGYIKGWEVAFAIKEYFDGKMGCSVYDVLPEIGKMTLLTPKPWKPVRKDPSELFTELQDTEWSLEYINHDRRIGPFKEN